jgi:hypothetical protein
LLLLHLVRSELLVEAVVAVYTADDDITTVLVLLALQQTFVGVVLQPLNIICTSASRPSGSSAEGERSPKMVLFLHPAQNRVAKMSENPVHHATCVKQAVHKMQWPCPS